MKKEEKMKKKTIRKIVITLFSLLLTLNLFSQVIDNSDIKFVLAPAKKQVHGELMRFHIEFKVSKRIGSGVLFGSRHPFYYQINLFHNSTKWKDIYGAYKSPNTVVNTVDPYDYINKSIIGGEEIYTYKSDSFNLNGVSFNNNHFPNGTDEYKLVIAGYVGGGVFGINLFDSNGDPKTGLTNGVKKFNINDICTNCNNGIFIDTDSDGDGVYDNEDDCPNKPGNPGNGCPGDPDLLLDESNSTSITTGCQCSTTPLSNKKSYALYLTDNLQLSLRVKNIGNYESGNYKVGVYSSATNNFSSASLIKQYNFSNLIPNKYVTKSIQLKRDDFRDTDGYGNTYLHIKIDNTNDVNEGSEGEKNNVFSSLHLKIKNTNRRGSRNHPIDFDVISIKDKFGRSIKTNVKIINKNQKENLIKSLSKGLYYIEENGKKSQLLHNR